MIAPIPPDFETTAVAGCVFVLLCFGLTVVWLIHAEPRGPIEPPATKDLR